MPGFGPGVNGGSLKRQYTQAEIEHGLMAMIAWAGNASAASRYLDQEGIDISSHTLSSWRTTHAAKYDEMREKYSGELETRLAHDMRDVAAIATQGAREAVELARERLENRADQDPGRTAANLARVAQSQTDKLLSLTGRPSRITEVRDTEAIIRSLVAKGIATVTSALPEGTESAEDA